MGGFDWGTGIAAAGKAMGDVAGDALMLRMKADMERQSAILSNQLIAKREHQARVETGAPEDVAAKRVEAAQKAASIRSMYKYLGIPIPADIESALPGAAGVTPVPSATQPILQGATAGSAAAAGGTPQATASPVATPLKTPAGPSGLVGSVPASAAGTTPASTGQIGVGTVFPPKGGAPPATTPKLPPQLANMSPEERQAFALSNPSKFFEIIAESYKPQNLGKGAVLQDAFGNVLGTNPDISQNMEIVNGKVQLRAGAKEALTQSSAATAEGTLPSELTKIHTTAAEARKTETHRVELADDHELVPAYDSDTMQTGVTTRGLQRQRITNKLGIAPGDTAPGGKTAGMQKDGSFIMKDGSVIPPLPDKPHLIAPNGMVPTQASETDKAKAEGYKGTIAGFKADYDSAEITYNQLESLAKVYKEIQTGSYTTNRAEFATRMMALGINPTVARQIAGSQNEAAARLAVNLNYRLALNELRKGEAAGGGETTTRATPAGVAQLSEQLSNPNLDPETNFDLLAEGEAIAHRQMSKYPGWIAASNLGWDPVTFDVEFDRANPLSTFKAQAYEHIGKLKGMEEKQAPKEGQIIDQGDKTFKVIRGTPVRIDPKTGQPLQKAQ